MSNEQHGPARKLVERAIEEWDAVQMSPYGEEVGAAEYELDVVRTLADAHDAAHAALVEAAERALASMSGILGSVGHDREAREQLRAALVAVRKGGDDGSK